MLDTDSSSSSASSCTRFTSLIHSKTVKTMLSCAIDYSPEHVKKYISSFYDSEESNSKAKEKELREIYATYLLKGIQYSIKYPFHAHAQSIITEYITLSRKSVSSKIIGRLAQSYEDAKLNALRSRRKSPIDIHYPASISDGETCLLLLKELKESNFGYVYEGFINTPSNPSFKIVIMHSDIPDEDAVYEQQANILIQKGYQIYKMESIKVILHPNVPLS